MDFSLDYSIIKMPGDYSSHNIIPVTVVVQRQYMILYRVAIK